MFRLRSPTTGGQGEYLGHFCSEGEFHFPNPTFHNRWFIAVELGAFLNAETKGPEHHALLRLIGTLVEVPPYADQT
jgi:hypothetical protein